MRKQWIILVVIRGELALEVNVELFLEIGWGCYMVEVKTFLTYIDS